MVGCANGWLCEWLAIHMLGFANDCHTNSWLCEWLAVPMVDFANGWLCKWLTVREWLAVGMNGCLCEWLLPVKHHHQALKKIHFAE